MWWWVLLIAGAGALSKGHPWAWAGWFAAGLLPLYLVSLLRHPRRVCRSCNGTGRHRGAMFFWGDRACTTCAGSPRHRRWGTQVLFGAGGRKTWAERAAGRARGRRSAPR